MALMAFLYSWLALARVQLNTASCHSCLSSITSVERLALKKSYQPVSNVTHGRFIPPLSSFSDMTFSLYMWLFPLMDICNKSNGYVKHSIWHGQVNLMVSLSLTLICIIVLSPVTGLGVWVQGHTEPVYS